MAYITREDGERFVIPSYRDVIAKRKALLKEDLLQLSAKYGEYITFHRRGLAQFEVAFSHEGGYLFGECVWTYFKRPVDMIYCEAIPDTTEAYLVIVKDSGVYLDGTFPLENIAEEILVFTTQLNNFEIYTYGDIPLSQEPLEGKIALDPQSIKSFNILNEPLFQHLPVVKQYQLQLLDVVLRQQGIGVFPVKYVIVVAVLLGLAWMGYTYVNIHKKAMPVVQAPPPPNPFLAYNNALASVPPEAEVDTVVQSINTLTTMPGWVPVDLNYKNGKLTVNVQSLGTNIRILYAWAEENNATVALQQKGFSLTMDLPLSPKRLKPDKIYPLDRVIGSLIDRMAVVMPGNVITVSTTKSQGVYKQSDLTINVSEVSPETLALVGEQLQGLPLILTAIALKINHGVTGTLTLQALGN